MPSRNDLALSQNRAPRPKPSRISGAIRSALAVTTAMFALAGAHAAPTAAVVHDLTQVELSGPGAAAVVGPVEILQAGDILWENVDDVYATDGAAPYDVTAVLLHSYAGDVVAYNDIDASIVAVIDADAGYVVAQGLFTYGIDSLVSNSGDIQVTADVDLGNSVAIGVASFGYYFSTVYNEAEGTISASASSGQGVYYGPDATAIAVFVTGTSAYSVNDGTIVAQAQADGEMSIAAATGVRSEGYYGFATMVNYGDIAAYATTTSNADTKTYAFAYGVDTQAHYNYFTASNVNYGDIHAEATAYRGAAISVGARASAKYAYTSNLEGGSISAVSTVEYSGLANATGVETIGIYYAHDVNAGSISAYASSHDMAEYGYFSYGGASATGVSEVASYFGGAVLENSGTISATAVTRDVAGFFFGGAAATGVYQNGKYYTGLDNSGDIHAEAYSEIGVVTAYGVISRSKYGSYTVVENHEGASIIAEAETASIADDYHGGIAISHGINMFGGSFALVYNDGLIAASAFVDPQDRDFIDQAALTYSYGVEMRGAYSATLFNTGDIEAYAGSDFGYASTYGAQISAQFYAVAYNDGDIVAFADADDGGAFATGVYTHGTGYAVYLGCDYSGCHYLWYDGVAEIVNTGSIYAGADAQGGSANAYGAVAISRYANSLDNSGEIVAMADAGSGYANAVAALLRSDYQGVSVHNQEGGVLLAGAYGDNATATGLWLGAVYDAYVLNEGSIVAKGDGERIAIDARNVAGNTDIVNYGLVSGSVLLGDGDDSFYNGTDGVLRLEDATVDMGLASYYGNRFDNYGIVRVRGASYVNMGGGFTLVPSANPYAFYNYGTIDLQDGAADDILVITGDFAGDGDINVDVSSQDGLSDILYVDGSVVSGTVNHINVHMLDFPDAATTVVPVVGISGDSVAGNFALGDVDFNPDTSFLSLDFSLIADIDASNTDPDVFSLGIEVSGLSDPGTLAASLGSSVQSLMNSQVGTWRQRMGVIDSFNKGGVALWARVFTDKGSFTPEHVAGNFGQGGNFDFDQKNSGVEGGVDFSVTDEFNIGLLLSKSKANSDIDGSSASSDIDADTWGVYGTWISPNGFYLDASYRWMNFDVDLSSVAGAMETSGDAEAFNVEMGYAWTLEGGLKIEPQLQYTRTSVNNLDVLVTTTGMEFAADGGDSSRGRLGVSIRKGFGEADNGWLWTPYATLSAVREFNGKSAYAINNTFFGETSVEGTSALLELGFTARHQNWAIYGGLNWQDGGAVNSFFGGQLGVRYTFGHAAPAPMPVAPPPAKTCADLDDDGDGVNNCDDKCLGSTAGEAVGADGCPVPAPEPVMEPKPYRN